MRRSFVIAVLHSCLKKKRPTGTRVVAAFLRTSIFDNKHSPWANTMLKPKYYPPLTVLAAALITVLPAGVFVLMGRSPFLDEQQATHPPSVKALNHSDESAATDDTTTAVLSGPTPAVATSSFVDDSFHRPPVTGAPDSTTRARSESDAIGMAESRPQDDTKERRRSLYGVGYWGTEELDLTGRIASSVSRTTKPASAEPVPIPSVIDDEDFSEDRGTMTRTLAGVADVTARMIETPTSFGTMKESSGHEMPTNTTPRTAERRAGSRKRSRKPVAESSSLASTQSPQLKTSDNSSPLVDLILQSPLESRGVQRVENVMAVTNETGWPIALIRSDLPDSRWWVQQITSITGKTFSARINFGNTESLSGGKYRLVFVFLDTRDEIQRFRIAKQFKEIPKGVRRSREYHHVLR